MGNVETPGKTNWVWFLHLFTSPQSKTYKTVLHVYQFSHERRLGTSQLLNSKTSQIWRRILGEHHLRFGKWHKAAYGVGLRLKDELRERRGELKIRVFTFPFLHLFVLVHSSPSSTFCHDCCHPEMVAKYAIRGIQRLSSKNACTPEDRLSYDFQNKF